TIAIRSSATPLRTGQETLLGQHGTARSELLPDKQGEVHLAGEVWTAELVEGEKKVKVGERVEVIAVDGLRLKVKKAA
ncbi:MAG: NfeD family protein, partial [Anaerolineae bacterium]|nr:NfeD family protein [Anaerolineae bacterium]